MRCAAPAALVVAVTLAGCGGSDSPPKVKPAVDDWAAAVRGFDGGLRSCGGHVTPARGIYAECMKPFARSSEAAAKRLRDAVRTSADARPSCRAQAATVASLTGSVADRQRAVVRADDAAKDDPGYAGPPPVVVEARIRRLIAGDVGRVHEAAAEIDRGCPKP
jgi:hypothetical protein